MLGDDCSLGVQTGAGKTHTMEGRQDPPTLRGIIPNSFQHIFDYVGAADNSKQFLVRASYLEIYNEEIRDLLSKDPKNKLELKENIETGVYVKDLTFFVVKNVTGKNVCAACVNAFATFISSISSTLCRPAQRSTT